MDEKDRRLWAEIRQLPKVPICRFIGRHGTLTMFAAQAKILGWNEEQIEFFKVQAVGLAYYDMLDEFTVDFV